MVLGGEHSHWLHVLSGVPQGPILGPLLFIVYMNDQVNVSLSQGCERVMFVDDILMFKPVTSDEDLASFQADIDRIANWMSANHLCLNPQKTKLMILSCNIHKPQPILFLNRTVLEQITHFKYLGILVSDNLTWNNHIEAICSKARLLLGYVYLPYVLPILFTRNRHPPLSSPSHPSPRVWLHSLGSSPSEKQIAS